MVEQKEAFLLVIDSVRSIDVAIQIIKDFDVLRVPTGSDHFSVAIQI